jgi:hypothetical protein
MSELAKIEHHDVAPISEGAAILQLIERAAANPSVDLDKMERLFQMRERFEKEAARKSFNAAVSAAKGEIGPIFKNRVVDFTSQKGRTNYRHEDFAEVARTVDPVLNRHGLSYRHRAKQEGQRLSVTCVLSHRDGHSEETTLEAAEDHSGNKNTIQAIGSASTYLQRYTLKLALGLSTSDQDDDARSSGSVAGVVSEEQIEELQRKIVQTDSDLPKFLGYFKIATLAEMPAKEFPRAMASLNKKAKQNG